LYFYAAAKIKTNKNMEVFFMANNRKYRPEKFKTKGHIRRHRVATNFDDEEFEKLKHDANEMQLGTYLREAWKGNVLAPIPVVNQEAWARLARMQANLNQLVMLLRCRNMKYAEAHEAYRLITHVRAALIGMTK
jgi:hypothetical protein